MSTTFLDEYIVIVLLTVAAALNVAVLRDVHIVESPVMTAGRRLVIGAQMWLALRFAFLIGSEHDSGLSWYGVAGYAAWCMGSSMCALNHLSQRWGWTTAETNK